MPSIFDREIGLTDATTWTSPPHTIHIRRMWQQPKPILWGKRMTVHKFQHLHPELNLCVHHLNFKHTKEYTLLGVAGHPRFRTLTDVCSFVATSLRPKVTTDVNIMHY